MQKKIESMFQTQRLPEREKGEHKKDARNDKHSMALVAIKLENQFKFAIQRTMAGIAGLSKGEFYQEMRSDPMDGSWGN